MLLRLIQKVKREKSCAANNPCNGGKFHFYNMLSEKTVTDKKTEQKKNQSGKMAGGRGDHLIDHVGQGDHYGKNHDIAIPWNGRNHTIKSAYNRTEKNAKIISPDFGSTRHFAGNDGF